METLVAQRKGTQKGAWDHLNYFLAGHPAPVGAYREVQTGRELRIEEEGILPATCDGHVAVYVRLPLTWAELHGQKNGQKKEGD